MANTFKIYKLIILYMLDKVDFPMTTAQISDFILEKGYTDYFKLQQTLSELQESGFIREESTHNRTYYHLTEEGSQTIFYFKNDLSAAIKNDVDNFLKDKKYDLKNEVSVKADYYPNKNGDYSIRCQIYEKNVLLVDLTVTAPTKDEATTIANNWTMKNEEIYALLMSKLLS